MQQDTRIQKSTRRKFINADHFQVYTQPKMLDAAQEMLTDECLSEEGFLGAQAVLMLNGIL